MPRFSDPKIVYTPRVSTSENNIHFVVTCLTRLIVNEIKHGGSGGRSPSVEQGCLGGRVPPNHKQIATVASWRLPVAVAVAGCGWTF